MSPLRQEIVEGPDKEDFKTALFGTEQTHGSPAIFRVRGRDERIFVCIHGVQRTKNCAGVEWPFVGHTTEPVFDVEGIYNPETHSGWMESDLFDK